MVLTSRLIWKKSFFTMIHISWEHQLGWQGFPKKSCKVSLLTFLLTDGFTFWKAARKCLLPTPKGLCSGGGWFSMDSWPVECTWIRSRRATIQASRTNAAKSAPLEERIVSIGLLRLFEEDWIQWILFQFARTEVNHCREWKDWCHKRNGLET